MMKKILGNCKHPTRYMVTAPPQHGACYVGAGGLSTALRCNSLVYGVVIYYTRKPGF